MNDNAMTENTTFTPSVFLDGKVELFGGDSREVLRGLPDNHFSSIVCDPPYALVSIVKRFGGENAAPAKDGDVYSRASSGFMGKQWDTGETAFATEFWAQIYRVLKPGGHVVAFSGTRSYHRLAVAIEDSGFEIRDMLQYLYGSGFPKSHAVDHSIWKSVIKCQSSDNAPLVVQISKPMNLLCEGERGNIVVAPALILPEGKPALIILTGKAEDSCVRTVISLSELTRETISLSTGLSWEMRSAENSDPRNMSTTETKQETTIDQTTFKLLTSYLTQKFTLSSVTLQNGYQWPAAIVADSLIGENTSKNAIPILTVAGNATWNPVVKSKGSGTALKPAVEPIVLARKPLSEKTVAANVLKWGTGALNVDGCRVGSETMAVTTSNGELISSNGSMTGGNYARVAAGEKVGRWPANILHDGSDEVLAGFPETGAAKASMRGDRSGVVTDFGGDDGLRGHNDNGGSAARFFYTAKADKLDRIGSKHPTVKPVDLMQWLCRLVTPPGGRILDPFAGSGSTGEAAWREGFSCVLIEREPEYQADIAERLNHANKGPMERKARAIKQTVDMGPLFGGANDNVAAG